MTLLTALSDRGEVMLSSHGEKSGEIGDDATIDSRRPAHGPSRSARVNHEPKTPDGDGHLPTRSPDGGPTIRADVPHVPRVPDGGALHGVVAGDQPGDQ